MYGFVLAELLSLGLLRTPLVSRPQHAPQANDKLTGSHDHAYHAAYSVELSDWLIQYSLFVLYLIGLCPMVQVGELFGGITSGYGRYTPNRFRTSLFPQDM